MGRLPSTSSARRRPPSRSSPAAPKQRRQPPEHRSAYVGGRDDVRERQRHRSVRAGRQGAKEDAGAAVRRPRASRFGQRHQRDRKSTRLNSSHLVISYAVFCLKKKNITQKRELHRQRLQNTSHTSVLYAETSI